MHLASSRKEKSRFKSFSGIVLLIFLFSYVLIAARLFNLQVIKNNKLVRISNNETSKIVRETSSRKDIVDRNGILLAASVPAYSVYAKTDSFGKIKKAAEIIGIDKRRLKLLLKRFSKGHFEWVARRIVLNKEKIKKLYSVRGIHLIKTTRRIYPQNELASHIIGFCGVDGEGLEGIEKRLNNEIEIKGDTKNLIFVDAAGRRIASRKIRENRPGKIVLTIDARVQAIVQNELADAAKKFDAKSASAILMKPNGEILAASSYPEYNLNDASKTAYDIIRSRFITDIFEPGSVFKIVTISAALDSGSVKPEELFFTHNGSLRVGNYTIHDSHPHRWLSATDIIVKSSNIGAMEIAGKIGINRFFKYIRRFGFGKKTGIELPGESRGIVKEKLLTIKKDFTTVAFGQGIAVTAMQIAKAFGIIANGGKTVYPHLLKMKNVKIGEPVIKKSTSEQVINILKAVVSRGTGKKAYIKGIAVAGKTGTAQIASKGGYAKGEYVSSFGGIFPADNPKAVLYIVFKDPQGSFYGGDVAAPVFKRIVLATAPIIGQMK